MASLTNRPFLRASLLLLFALVFNPSILRAGDFFEFGTAVNPEGRTVRVNSDGLVIDGQPVLPVMGEIHFARVPQADWQREIRKMKAGGITVVSTYVFWIHHEEEEGHWNWSGNRDLHRFLEVCQAEGMPVVIRVGPFCHGEVYQGGFPVWLVEKALADPANFKIRSLAPGFIEATRQLYSQIFSQVSDMMWKNGGPIIGMQLENECRGPWAYYMKLKEMALEIGFDLPFYTRTGWPKLNGKETFGEFLPLYGDYADGFWDRTLDDMPGSYAQAFVMKNERLSAVIATETFGTDQNTALEKKDLQYPYFTCELGGGMMTSYHRRINISGREILPLAICKLGSGSNLPGYYMYHGGTNPYCDAHTMAETQASPVTNYNDMPYLSYDFQSPLGEMGQLNETAFHTSRWLHQFLADWGGELSQMPVDTLSEHYARRGCFVFRNDYVRILNESGTASVTPENMEWKGLHITSSSVQPFAKADGMLYFITVPGQKPRLRIDGRCFAPKLDRTLKVKNHRLMVLSPEMARTAYVIDGKMCFSGHGGVLYKDGDGIVEEAWENLGPEHVQVRSVCQAVSLREVPMGIQKVAAMPVEADFDKAAVWTLSFDDAISDGAVSWDDLFLKISYRGDVARVYADGKLVEDNFWNGKDMLVRMSELKGKKVELRILPMGKDYPIYLQREQRAVLERDAVDGALCALDAVCLLNRKVFP